MHVCHGLSKNHVRITRRVSLSPKPVERAHFDGVAKDLQDLTLSQPILQSGVEEIDDAATFVKRYNSAKASQSFWPEEILYRDSIP
jgi:hypothetical protein